MRSKVFGAVVHATVWTSLKPVPSDNSRAGPTAATFADVHLILLLEKYLTNELVIFGRV